MQAFNGVGRPNTLPLARRKPRELPVAVGERIAFLHFETMQSEIGQPLWSELSNALFTHCVCFNSGSSYDTYRCLRIPSVCNRRIFWTETTLLVHSFKSR